MKNFRIQFDVPETKLATVVSLISGEVSNLVIRDTATIQGAVVAAAPPIKRQRQVQRKTDTAIGKVHAAMAGFKVGTEVPYTKVMDVLKTAGYNPNSHTSIISQMVNHGFAERHKPQWFRIVKAFE